MADLKESSSAILDLFYQKIIMNVISYNLKRHIELLNHQKNVISQDKSFFKENQAEFLELSRYNAAVDQHIFWENRFEVASLIQTFLN